MTRTAKLYDRLLASRGEGVPFRDFERLLAAFGFTHDRTVGSNRQYVHPKVPRSFPVQPTGKGAKAYQVRQFLAIVEQYELELGS